MSDGDLTGLVSEPYVIKDSGARQEFAGGMVRDTQEGKIDWLNLRFGPLYRRIAAHLTKGREKYPDPEPGVPNWTLARGRAEALRAKQSAARHFESWLNGETDEDHAAAVPFNINLFEYIRELDPSIPPSFGTGAALATDTQTVDFGSDAVQVQLYSLGNAELGETLDDDPEPRPLQVGDRVRYIGTRQHGQATTGQEGVIVRIEDESFSGPYPYTVDMDDHPGNQHYFAGPKLERIGG